MGGSIALHPRQWPPMPPLLLLTRPEGPSRRFAAEAAVLPPHEVLIAPLTEVVALPFDRRVFDGAEGVILTSANAVPMLPRLPGLPAWCVGAATAKAAQAAGFAARNGGGDAAALLRVLEREGPKGTLVYAHGADIARDLAAELPGLRAVAVYDARARDPGPKVQAALAGSRPVIAPLFSPRSAQLFAALPGALTAPALHLVAISPACAAALPAPLAAIVADTPDSGGMLRAIRAAMPHPALAG